MGNISIGQVISIEPAQLVWFNKQLLSAIMYDPWVIPLALDFLQNEGHRLPLQRIVSHKFPLEEVNEAFQAADWQGHRTDVCRAVIIL